MNIYEKISAVRNDLQNGGMQKSGNNAFAKYSYFELSDMLPEINRLEQTHKLCSIVSFSQDMATLTIIDAEKPDVQVLVTSPMSTAELKSCHPVQNLGAVQTYTRRYLYTAAYAIVECDALDATTGADKSDKTSKSQKSAQAPTTPATQPQDDLRPADHPNPVHLAALYKMAETKGYTKATIANHCMKHYKLMPEKISMETYNDLIVKFSELPDKEVSA